MKEKNPQNDTNTTNKFNTFCEYFTDLDLYGTKPGFKINFRDNFKTAFGSTLSILSIIVTIFSFFYFSLQIFDVTNPRLVFSITNIFNPPLLVLNQENFGFAFGLQNPFTYDQFIDESVYYPLVYQMTGSRVQKGNDTVFEWTVIPLELERCSISKFPKAYRKIMKDLPFASYYCLKNTTFSVEGTFLNSQYSYLMIKLYECKNATDSAERVKSNFDIDKNYDNNFESDKVDFSFNSSNYRRFGFGSGKRILDEFDDRGGKLNNNYSFSYGFKGDKRFRENFNYDLNSSDYYFGDSYYNNGNFDFKDKIEIRKDNDNKLRVILAGKNLANQQNPHRSLIDSLNLRNLQPKPSSVLASLDDVKPLHCKSKEYIDKILAGTFFNLPFTDITIDPTNYNNANQILTGDSYTTVSNKFFKEMHHYLRQIQMTTDNGLLFSEKQTFNYLQNDFIKEMTDFRKADNFLSYSIKLSTRKETYNRSYAKLQNIAAELGGMLKLLNMTCMIFSFYFNKSKFYELIANEIFDVNLDEKGKFRSLRSFTTNFNSVYQNDNSNPSKFVKEIRKDNNNFGDKNICYKNTKNCNTNYFEDEYYDSIELDKDNNNRSNNQNLSYFDDNANHFYEEEENNNNNNNKNKHNKNDKRIEEDLLNAENTKNCFEKTNKIIISSKINSENKINKFNSVDNENTLINKSKFKTRRKISQEKESNPSDFGRNSSKNKYETENSTENNNNNINNNNKIIILKNSEFNKQDEKTFYRKKRKSANKPTTYKLNINIRNSKNKVNNFEATETTKDLVDCNSRKNKELNGNTDAKVVKINNENTIKNDNNNNNLKGKDQSEKLLNSKSPKNERIKISQNSDLLETSKAVLLENPDKISRSDLSYLSSETKSKSASPKNKIRMVKLSKKNAPNNLNTHSEIEKKENENISIENKKKKNKLKSEQNQQQEQYRETSFKAKANEASDNNRSKTSLKSQNDLAKQESIYNDNNKANFFNSDLDLDKKSEKNFGDLAAEAENEIYPAGCVNSFYNYSNDNSNTEKAKNKFISALTLEEKSKDENKSEKTRGNLSENIISKDQRNSVNTVEYSPISFKKVNNANFNLNLKNNNNNNNNNNRSNNGNSVIEKFVFNKDFNNEENISSKNTNNTNINYNNIYLINSGNMPFEGIGFPQINNDLLKINVSAKDTTNSINDTNDINNNYNNNQLNSKILEISNSSVQNISIESGDLSPEIRYKEVKLPNKKASKMLKSNNKITDNFDSYVEEEAEAEDFVKKVKNTKFRYFESKNKMRSNENNNINNKNNCINNNNDGFELDDNNNNQDDLSLIKQHEQKKIKNELSSENASYNNNNNNAISFKNEKTFSKQILLKKDSENLISKTEFNYNYSNLNKNKINQNKSNLNFSNGFSKNMNLSSHKLLLLNSEVNEPLQDLNNINKINNNIVSIKNPSHNLNTCKSANRNQVNNFKNLITSSKEISFSKNQKHLIELKQLQKEKDNEKYEASLIQINQNTQKPNENAEGSKIYLNTSINNININNNNTNTNTKNNNFNNSNQKPKYKTRLKFFDSICYSVCRLCKKQNKDFKIIDRVKLKTDDLLDIVKFLKEIIDIERLKRILLNNEQLGLFECPFYLPIMLEWDLSDLKTTCKSAIKIKATRKIKCL